MHIQVKTQQTHWKHGHLLKQDMVQVQQRLYWRGFTGLGEKRGAAASTSKNPGTNRLRKCFTMSTAHNAGPALSVENQSCHQTCSQSSPTVTKKQAEISQRLHPPCCAGTSSPGLGHQGGGFPCKPEQKKPPSCCLEEHPTRYRAQHHISCSKSNKQSQERLEQTIWTCSSAGS